MNSELLEDGYRLSKKRLLENLRKKMNIAAKWKFDNSRDEYFQWWWILEFKSREDMNYFRISCPNVNMIGIEFRVKDE